MQYFANGELRFDVSDGGDPAGPPVVLLHGFPAQPSSFDDVRPGLHDAGLRTLVPTQRGYRAAARPRRRRDYRLSELVGDVVALLDEAGIERAHIVGHDWGGGQAWGMAGLHPDRVLSVTALSTPHPAAAFAAVRTSDQGRRSWYMGLFQLPLVAEGFAGATLRRSLTEAGLPDHHVESYVAGMQRSGALTGALNWYRGLPFSRGTNVGRIRVPTTYVWGSRDPFLGRAAAEGTAGYVDGPYAFIELDAGHWLPEKYPEPVTRAILERIGSVS